MITLVKIAIVFLVLAVMTWRKLPVGVVLMISALALLLLFQVPPLDILVNTSRDLVSLDMLSLTAIILLVTAFGHILKEVEKLDGLLAAMRDLIPSPRINLVMAPAAVGLLPMPGGALLSAPMVGGIAEQNEIDMTPEQATMVNYWFRHLWEYSWPLYPALALFQELTEAPLRDLVITNLPLTLFAVATGAVLYIRKLPKGAAPPERVRNLYKDLRQLAANFWPIVIVIVASIVFGLPLVASLGATSLLLVVLYRMPREKVLRILKETFRPQLILLVLGIKIFGSAVEHSGCVPHMLDAFNQLGLPAPVLIFSIPFLVAFMTGLAISYVSVATPILLSLLVDETGGSREVLLHNTMLFYAGGYYGTLMSPVHLCLILTKDHFKADLGKVYRLLTPGVLVLVVLALIYYIILTGMVSS
jgi:integral membrane protein (TIGR00529 family)